MKTCSANLNPKVADRGCCSYNNSVRITFDSVKRDRALTERGLDFADAAIVFERVTLEMADIRKEYDEDRIICYGMLAGRM